MTAPSEHSHPHRLLEDREIEATLKRLEAVARRVIATRGIPHRADVQPDSVAHSVMAHALGSLPKANDREHLLAILSAAVEHKIIDRLRRGGKRGREKNEADRHAPLPEVEAPPEIDVDAEEEGAIARFQAIGSRAIESAETWRLVELHALRDMPLGDVAASLSISRDAAKARYHSARGAILSAVMSPVVRALSDPDARVANAVFRERLDIATAASELGRPSSEIRHSLVEVVLPALLAAYGRAGTNAITTLARRGR